MSETPSPSSIEKIITDIDATGKVIRETKVKVTGRYIEDVEKVFIRRWRDED